MNRLFLALIPLLVLTLSACDLASRFVPPIEVGNVFGLGTPDAPTTLRAPAFEDPEALGTFAIVVRQEGAFDYERTDLTFADVELPNMRGFSIDALWVTIGLDNTLTLERIDPLAEFPDRFTLTSFEGRIEIRDAQNVRAPVEYHFAEQEIDLEFARAGTCGLDACEYRATVDTNALQSAMLFEIPESDGQIVKNLMTLVSEGGENTAQAKIRVTASTSTGNIRGFAPVLRISNPSTKVSLGG